MDPTTTAAPDQTAPAAPAAPDATAPASDGTDMTMLVTKNGGAPFPITASHLMNTLRAPPEQGGAGLSNIAGISQDGSRLHLQNEVAGPPDKSGAQPSQTREMHIQTAAKALGLDIKSVTPPSPDTDPENVSKYLSGVIPTMATDDEKHNFIRNHLKSEGFDDPHVVGSGSNWYNYEPDLGKWYQVTKAPDLHDGSGWLNAALSAPQMLGSGLVGAGGAGLGMSAGSAGGPLGSVAGAVAGGAAGGAVGSAAGQGLTKSALALYDPDYRKALNGAEEANQIGGNSLKDAAVMGVGGPLGEALAPVAKGAGRLISGLGSLTSGVGKVVSNPATSEFIANSIPGAIGNITSAAEIPQLAQSAVKGAPRAMQWLADTGLGKSILSEEQRASLSGAGESLLRNGDSAEGIGQSLANNSRVSAFSNAENQAVEAGTAQRLPGSAEERASAAAAEEYGKSAGLPDEDINWIKSELSKKLPASEEGAPWEGVANAMPESGLQQAGRGLDSLADVGRSISQPIAGAVRGIGKGAVGVGESMKSLGNTGIPAGAAAAQYYGIPEAGKALREYLIKKIQDDRDKNSMLPSR